ncbi:MAG TPA: hypothetical protein VMT66_11865 [Steroidobacteraceae bacterium]|nr:hypothetical protein [Steroidobacteraceae bacterium]
MDKGLEQAIRTLRGIRHRYETGHATEASDLRAYTVQMSLGYADMRWITAALDALEKLRTVASD